MTAVASGYVRITCSNPWMNLTCLLGPETPRIINSDNGWEIKARPKQVGMTVWNGVEPIQAEFTFLLDGFRTGPDMSQRLDSRFIDPQTPNIERLWAVSRGDGDSQPGLINVEGIPEFPNIDWLIETIEFQTDGSIRSDDNFKQGRQMVHVVIREYSPPRYASAKAPTGSPKGKTVTWKVKRSDTPTTIAKRIGCQWTDIRELNKKVVKKANQNLKDGTKIRVPATKNANKIARGRAKH